MNNLLCIKCETEYDGESYYYAYFKREPSQVEIEAAMSQVGECRMAELIPDNITKHTGIERWFVGRP
jgi:hypothetical protein